MDNITGSLSEFFIDLPRYDLKIGRNTPDFIIPKKRMIFNSLRHLRSPLPDFCLKNIKKITLMPKLKLFPMKKSSTPTLSPLNPLEKIREELILDRYQLILRSMKSNIREDERKRTQAMLEQKTLEKVLNSIKNTSAKREIFKFDDKKKFLHSKNHALHTFQINNQKKWISTHMPK